MLNLRSARRRVDEADPELLALEVLAQQVGELLQRDGIILPVAIHLGDLDAEIAVLLLLLGQPLVNRERLFVIPLPGQYVREQPAGGLFLERAGGLLGQVDAGLLSGRLVVLRLAGDEDVLLAILA